MSDQVQKIEDQADGTIEPIVKTKAVVQKRADQDQIIANFIGDLEANLDSLDGDTYIAERMATRGFKEPKRAEGRIALTALKAKFQGRQVTLGTQGEKATASEAGEKVARKKYADFRGTVRTAYTDADTRRALGVSGLVPADTEKFLTLAEVGYSAAEQAPYGAGLEALGFDAAERTASVVTLTDFRAAREVHRTAVAAAKVATRERDAAYKVALKWNRDLLRMAKIALRERPDLLAKLR